MEGMLTPIGIIVGKSLAKKSARFKRSIGGCEEGII